MRRIVSSFLTLAVSAALAGCDLEVEDLNSPGLDDLEDHPTRVVVAAATTGLIIGHRITLAPSNGYVAQLGILGREGYNFDGADPRFIGELLTGRLNPGGPFGGGFWASSYANQRQGQIILDSKDKVTEFTPAEQSALTGFVKTIMALDLLVIVNTRDTNGAVIDSTKRPGDDLAPVVDKTAALAEVAKRLDDGKVALMAGGMSFPFKLSNGFAGFNTPATFLRFNRAIRARVAAYQGDYATVLTALSESFISTESASVESLNAGVYMTYSTASGDTTNALVNPNIFANTKLVADAKKQAANAALADARVGRKTATVEEAGESNRISSDVVFTLYTDPEAPVPLIRNEELILLRAEAKALGSPSDLVGAMEDLNIVRTVSGGLAQVAGLTAETFKDELLYDRRYSLLFEGGHRWIDLRRFNKPALITADDPVIPDDPETPEVDPVTFVLNIRYPIPRDECNARPGEPKCALGSN